MESDWKNVTDPKTNQTCHSILLSKEVYAIELKYFKEDIDFNIQLHTWGPEPWFVTPFSIVSFLFLILAQ